MKSFIVFACFVLLLPQINFGTDFQYLRTREGLIDGEITSIVQDSTGYMWFASYSGLTRYDGLNMEVFRPEMGNPGSLSDKKIKFLFVDSEGNLWVASNRTLNLFNKINKSFCQISFERDSDSEINILNISEYQKHIVIHTVEGFFLFPLNQCLNKNYKAKKREFVHLGQLSNQYFHLSKGTGDFLFMANNSTNQPSEMYSAELLINNGDTLFNLKLITQLNEQINSINLVRQDKSVFLGTSDGVRIFSLNTNKFQKTTHFKGINIAGLLFASNHKLYCHTNSRQALFCVDMHTGLTNIYTPNPNINGSLLNSRILNLYEDYSGNLWIGHQGLGISILNLNKKEFNTFRRDPFAGKTLNSNTILCFAETDNEYLIGCRSNGLNIVNKNQLTEQSPVFDSYTLPGARQDDGIWDIEKENDSVFWLATESGLFKLTNNRNNWEIKPFKGEPAITELVWKILIDDNNNIWCGTFNGGLIFIPDPSRNLANKYYRYTNVPDSASSISDNYVKEIFIDSKKRFWVGTLYGLNQLKISYDNLNLSGKDRPKLEFRRYEAGVNDPQKLNNQEINCLYENYDGNIWILTNGGGINILNPETDNFEYLTIENGLPSNDVYGIVSDDSGCLWISTLNGLFAYDQLEEAKTIHAFDYHDGIQGDIFMVNSYYKAMDGMLFFGGDNGFTSFYPDKIKMNKIKPKLAFKNLYFQTRLIEAGDTIRNGFILENELDFTEKIVLPFKRSYFKIEISTLHYQSPQKNRFTYKLDGRMSNWNTVLTQNNSIEFANLPFGKYTLYVKAINSDNVKSDTSKILNIEIEPPWYLTWYMSTIFLIVGLLILIGFIYILVNRQKLIYQKRIDALTIENNENKMMFLTNIAHELRTPLSLVIAPIEDLMHNSRHELNGWKGHFQLIHRNANYLLRLVNQIIDFRKLNAGKLKLNTKKTDVVRVIKDVVLNFKDYESKRNIKLSMEVPAEVVEIIIDPQKIEEVLYNLLSNAYKNTFDNGSIVVSMSYQKPANTNLGKIKISVFNEGKEISEEDRYKVFERFYKIDEQTDGAGIGLSFSKSLVDLHGGKMWVESVKGRGVVFHVEIPFDEIHVSTEHQFVETLVEQDLIQTETFETNSFNSNMNLHGTILIVEDNPELRDFLQMVLSRNYRCLVASNGAEGWEIVKKEIPSIVISDIIMPEMDGYELCKLTKQKKETCHIPVILLSAKDTGNHQIKGYEVGADAFVAKPFEINILLSQISRFLKNRDLCQVNANPKTSKGGRAAPLPYTSG